MRRTLWLLSMLAWPLASGLCQETRNLDPARYKSEMELFKNFDARNTLPSRPILFIGSSSIEHWETSRAFPRYPVVNRGLGGAVFPDLLYYYDDLVKKYRPAIVVVYCDNDVLYGTSADTVLRYFKDLSGKIVKDFPRAQIVFLSMKPTPSIDAAMQAKLDTANAMFKSFTESRPNMRYIDVASPMLGSDGRAKPDIFLSDGEHLNAQGYETIWNPIVGKQLSQLYSRTRVAARGK